MISEFRKTGRAARSIPRPLGRGGRAQFDFIVVAVSTVGFGDIVPVTGIGKLVTVVMIISGIILIPFQAARIFRAWMASDRERKVQICPGCGLDRHDADARYCKACGEALPGDR
ncbi:MAG: potassium channel family protein, partial [Methanothrix sp.]|nr:potassium channel family protein [Methanothrix sp.]